MSEEIEGPVKGMHLYHQLISFIVAGLVYPLHVTATCMAVNTAWCVYHSFVF